MNTLISQLEIYMKGNKLSTKDIASELDVPVKTVQKWLTKGKSHYEPSASNQEKLKKFLYKETQPQLGSIESKVDALVMDTTSLQVPSGDEHIKLRTEYKKRNKTLREPIQLDIELTPLEIGVIDTADFQRLAYIKQLGTASFVYPGATHTRFEHSLGTLAIAQSMIDAINKNPDNQKPISDDIKKLIRMCAILHDITHIPYGHILEDEGFLYKRHDEVGVDSRWERFLGPNSEIGRVLAGSEKGEGFRQQVFDYLTTKDEQIKLREHPYVIDIVGNTVCADLIDYLARDTYYAGLKETFDPRFLKYIIIASYEGEENNHLVEKYKDRLVLSLIKDNRVRRDVISEVMHLLRLRYSLAEKVYFHHAKIVVSAMIIEAVQAAKIMKPSDFSEEELCELKFGDVELLLKLRGSHVPIAEKIVNRLTTRSLYRPVYMLTFSLPTPEDTSWEKKTEIIKKFRKNPEERYNLERRLEKWNNLEEGSVIIYCPTEKMNLKQVETLCLWRNGQITKLIKVPGEKVSAEARTINDAHMELWKLFVLLQRGIPRELEITNNLASDCYHEFGLPNAIEELREVGSQPITRYVEEWAKSFPELNVTIPEREKIVGLRSIYKERLTGSPPSYEQLKDDLEDLRKSS